MRAEKGINLSFFSLSFIVLMMLNLNLEASKPGRDIYFAPVLSKIEIVDLEYPAGSGKSNITSSLTIQDIDSRFLLSASIRITEGYVASEDELSFKNHNGITGNWNKLSGILLLTGISTLANYQTALRNVLYENTNKANPSSARRRITITVSDGLSNSNTVFRFLNIINPNKKPEIFSLETASAIYCSYTDFLNITHALTLTDKDDENLTAAVIRISGTYVKEEDMLHFTDQNGISGNWNASSGRLELAGLSTVANYQQALRSIQYKNTHASAPHAGNRVLSIIVFDGKDSSNTAKRTLVVNAPVRAVLSGSGTYCVDEDQQEVPVRIQFTGTPPFRFTITRDGGNNEEYTNVVQNPYTLTIRQEGTYRIKSISDAYCTGDTAGSGSVRVRFFTRPTAVISGTDTVCAAGGNAELPVTLTGIAPWKITYVRDGSHTTIVDDIESQNYTLKVTEPGSYVLTSLEDARCSNGKTSGEGLVEEYTTPTALISGNATICENSSTNLKIDLSGTPPWKLSYKHDNGSPVQVNNINSSPATLSVNQEGTYVLAEISDLNCRGTVSGQAAITVTPAPEVSITGLAPSYIVNMFRVPIFGNPPGGTFAYNPAVIKMNDTVYFYPIVARVGTHKIIYSYQSPSTRCYGYDTAVVNVLADSAAILFQNNRKKYCSNDNPFTVTGINVGNSNGTFTISGGKGLTDHHDNTATIYPDSLPDGKYTITYTYFNTSLSAKSEFEIGPFPAADFYAESECFNEGQSIKFRDASNTSYGIINGYKWKIYNDTGYDSVENKEMEYTFTAPGIQTIQLQISTSFGCSGAIKKQFLFNNPIVLRDSGYTDNFESNEISWSRKTLTGDTVNSWVLTDTSLDYSHARSGRKFWYTKIENTLAPIEHSSITSPCFDFSATRRPMLIMEIWRKFNNLRDGAVLQFTADSGRTWQNVGEPEDGINWFNQVEITGNPGGQPIGWSNVQDNDWVETRHGLDFLRGKKLVQFRLAYGSDGTAINTNGLAFDNFRILERNRLILVEHFTNTSNIPSKTADDSIGMLWQNDSMNILTLQYHTSFPGTDPFNEQEPFGPSARALYYGVSKVPYTLLNGGYKPPYRFDYVTRELKPGTIQGESLSSSKFDLGMYAELRGNTVYISTFVRSRQDMPWSEYSVHTGVLERKITGIQAFNGDTSFDNVVRALLPDPGGITVSRSWDKGDSLDVRTYWDIHDIYNLDQIRVFAFIQDEATQEVYQAAWDTLQLVTALNDLKGREPGFIAYPNPANDKVLLRFDNVSPNKIKIELFNDNGIAVWTSERSVTGGLTEIPVAFLPPGIYIVRVQNNSSLSGVRKITISR